MCYHNNYAGTRDLRKIGGIRLTGVQIGLSVAMIVASLFLICVVLLQNGAAQGIGAVSGGAETFFGSGKASASDKVFARLTSVVGILFVIIAIVLNIVH